MFSGLNIAKVIIFYWRDFVSLTHNRCLYPFPEFTFFPGRDRHNRIFKEYRQRSKRKIKGVYLPPDPSPLEPVHGLDVRIKVRSEQTNMQYSSIDFAVAPKTMGPAPHVHEALDKLMYVRSWCWRVHRAQDQLRFSLEYFLVFPRDINILRSKICYDFTELIDSQRSEDSVSGNKFWLSLKFPFT